MVERRSQSERGNQFAADLKSVIRAASGAATC
jgi:hypothetical protein